MDQSQVVAASMEWLPVAELGAVGVALITAIVLFLKHIRAQSENQREHIKHLVDEGQRHVERVTGDFSKTMDKASESFNETTQIILRDGEKREERLHTLIRDRAQHS